MPEPAAVMHGTLLYLDGVTVSFDGFHALDGLSLIVDPGELRTIIGPNGAGKTTMMDVVTGKTRPDEGQVLFDGGIDLTRLDEAAIANLGIGRKFQKPTVFENLSVLENLELAFTNDRRTLPTLLARLGGQQHRRIEEVLETIGLGAHKHAPAGTLSHGQKQWLEIGMLLVQDAQLLLLDEPVAGMSDRETEKTATLIRGIVGARTVLVVGHDMAVVRELDARTTVLHEGKVLAEGSVAAVQANPRVIEVYLGR
jgi:urea transport system ATP-binding protein